MSVLRYFLRALLFIVSVVACGMIVANLVLNLTLFFTGETPAHGQPLHMIAAAYGAMFGGAFAGYFWRLLRGRTA